MGSWEKCRWEQIAREDPEHYDHWMKNWRTSAPPGGESLPVFDARVKGWLNYVSNNGPQLLIAHPGVIRALRVRFEDLEWTAAMSLAIPHLE
jgi:alpha-ribazole phosphatase